jgi:hypothetical protein
MLVPDSASAIESTQFTRRPYEAKAKILASGSVGVDNSNCRNPFYERFISRLWSRVDAFAALPDFIHLPSKTTRSPLPPSHPLRPLSYEKRSPNPQTLLA